MPNVTLLPSDGVPKSFQGSYSGVVNPNVVTGAIIIDVRDLPEAQRGGFLISESSLSHASLVNPAAASATAIIANVAAANGALTIAAQPDVARPLSFVVARGTPGFTAGSLSVDANWNDGSSSAESVSLVGDGNQTITTRGVVLLNGATLSGLVGGTTPTIQAGTTAALAVPISPGSVGVALRKEVVNGTIVNTGAITNGGIYTPAAAPDGTNDYELDIYSSNPGF